MLDKKIVDTVKKLQIASRNIPKIWNGRNSVLEMKNAGSRQWKQTEWIGFYFEFLCETHFDQIIGMPGKKYGNTEFDAFHEISWDFKTHAANAKHAKYEVIANDVEAMNNTISDYGYYGMILAIGEAEYNDDNGTFKKWHDKLKGKISQYRKDRIEKGAKSRLRKTKLVLSEIHFICLNSETLDQCSRLYHQGKNSNGKPRPPKYNVNIQKILDSALVATEEFK